MDSELMAIMERIDDAADWQNDMRNPYRHDPDRGPHYGLGRVRTLVVLARERQRERYTR